MQPLRSQMRLCILEWLRLSINVEVICSVFPVFQLFFVSLSYRPKKIFHVILWGQVLTLAVTSVLLYLCRAAAVQGNRTTEYGESAHHGQQAGGVHADGRPPPQREERGGPEVCSCEIQVQYMFVCSCEIQVQLRNVYGLLFDFL